MQWGEILPQSMGLGDILVHLDDVVVNVEQWDMK